GRMMMDEDPVAGPKFTHARADFLDHADRLMAKHERRLAPDVPRHDVAGADAAGADAHQHIGAAHRGSGTQFHPDIAEIVETRDLHCHARTLWSASPDVNSAVPVPARSARCFMFSPRRPKGNVSPQIERENVSRETSSQEFCGE